MDEWRIIRERRTGYGQRRRMRSSQDIYESFREHFARLDREHFVVLLLDAKNTMLGFYTVEGAWRRVARARAQGPRSAARRVLVSGWAA